VSRRVPLLLAAAMGCSTLAPKAPEVECTTNEECVERLGVGFVCAVDVCRDGSNVPPIEYIGLDVQEVLGGQTRFRAEVAGCDAEVIDDDTSNGVQVLSVPRREVAQRLRLAAYNELPPDTGAPSVVPSTFTVSQDSRFAREAQERQVTYDPEDPSTDPTVELSWPRYTVDNDLPSALADGGYLLWETQPLSDEDSTPRALRYQFITPPVSLGEGEAPCLTDLDCCPQGETCDPDDVRNACVTTLGECRHPFDDTAVYTYTYVYNEGCDRELNGRVVTVNDNLDVLGPMRGAGIVLRHADTEGEDPLTLTRLDDPSLAEREPECSPSVPCPDGLVCNETTEQCDLPLPGLTAWTGTVPTEADDGVAGNFEARVYIYCDAFPTTTTTRSFDATITPPDELGAPSVTLHIDAVFDPVQPGGNSPADYSGDLCVPTIGAQEDITLALSGAPRSLLPGYTCCDIDCLPRTADDAESGPPEASSQCSGATSGSTPVFRAETPLILDDEVLTRWNADDSPCVPVRPDENDAVGVLRRSGSCGTTSMTGTPEDDALQCNLQLPANSAEGARTYDLRIETPTGSVSGSVDTNIDVAAEPGTTIYDIALPDRIMVRGRVVVGDCDEDGEADGDCGSPGAQVLAERLRMAGETVANTPGPYFHQVPTFYDPTAADGERDGSYVLPLDPGVWIVTALPDSGTDGGPAHLSLLDLRTGATQREKNFELEPGILVTIDVSSFDRRSAIIPLDTGSWALETDDQLTHPDRMGQPDEVLDLGAPGECLSADATIGCRIRRLVAGSSLPPSQIGQVRFTTRDLGVRAVDCR